MSLSTIPNILAILSGKGGVGKSSVTVQLALSLTLRGYSVGVLDIDLTGPSIPRLFGIESAKVRQAPGGWLPVEVHPNFTLDSSALQGTSGGNAGQGTTNVGRLCCMSLGFLLRDRGDAVIWRGPKKTAMVKQLLSDVLWPSMDYLLIDTPPGTSDEHISLITNLLDPTRITPSQRLGAVVVTTPQAISTADVKKELTFCQKVGLRVLGVVENMAGYVCPCCGEVTNVFSKGGGAVMAQEWGVRFLGSVPLDGEGWGMLVEEGRRPAYETAPNGDAHNEHTPILPMESNGHNDNIQQKDDGRLVDKYTSCSLYPIFDKIVEQLLTTNGTIPSNMNTT